MIKKSAPKPLPGLILDLMNNKLDEAVPGYTITNDKRMNCIFYKESGVMAIANRNAGANSDSPADGSQIDAESLIHVFR